MPQQQFKMGISLSTKLLLMIGVLLITPIFFLNISAVSLFQSDKKAYVYDSQATSVVLAGREFVGFVDQALGSLKLIMGTVDFSKNIQEQAKKNIQFYLENQRSLVGMSLMVLKKGAPVQPFYEYFLPGKVAGSKPLPDTVRIESRVLETVRDKLEQQGVWFKNISKAGSPPVLAIVFADKAHVKLKDALVIAVGYADLSALSGGVTDSFNRFVIADRTGSVLFTSETKLMYASLNVAGDDIFRDSWAGSVKSGAKEYVSPEGVRTLGSFYKPGLDLLAMSQIDYDKAMQATYTLTGKFVLLALAALGAMLGLGLVFAKSLIRPLRRLFAATAQVSSGNFDVNLPVETRDEIGALTNSFVAMSGRIKGLLDEMVDKVRVDQEVEIARTVQQSLFPPTLIENEELQVATLYQSASECGGDWVGYFKAGVEHVLVVADATGHGLPSALMTASARSCFSVLEKFAVDGGLQLDPGQMLEVANRVVYDSAQGKIMMTCGICIVNFEERLIKFASAAHNPPWLFSPAEGGGFSSQSLVSDGQRLGEAPSLETPFEVKTVTFNKGDTLVMYTDGLLEGKNLKAEQYGKKKSRQVLEGAMSADPQSIITALMKDFMGHNAGKPLDDDVTLAVVRMLA